MEASRNNTDFSAKEYWRPITVPSSATGDFHFGEIVLPPYCKLYLKAVGYGLTASLIIIPRLPEGQ